MNLSKEQGFIDPIYHRYMTAVTRALSDTAFYEMFMQTLASGTHEIQFSNRKIQMVLDSDWIDIIENTLQALQRIIQNPRQGVLEEELIVNVAHAKKGGADVVRHLAQNASMVDDFDAGRGRVQPGRLMQKMRDDTLDIYENTFAFTALEHTHRFVKIRHDVLSSAMADELGAKLNVHTQVENDMETIQMDSFVHIQKKDNILDTEDKHGAVFARVSKLYRVLEAMMNSQFAKRMASCRRVRGNVVMTNVLKKDPQYRQLIPLWDMLRHYEDVGYSVNIVEQNPAVDDVLMQNIYHNQLFQYITLKGYLEDKEDRKVVSLAKEEKRTLRPKFIRQIVEELTADYDLPDVEIRKVLIEELTREQLMAEEEAERQRLLDEAEERNRLIRVEEEKVRALEEERLRQEEKLRAENLRHQQLLQKAEDQRRGQIFTAQLELFKSKLNDQIALRNLVLQEMQFGQKDFATALELAEAQEQMRGQERQRIAQRREAEKQRLEAERAAQQEEERLRQARQAQLAEAHRQKLEEDERHKDRLIVQRYLDELEHFANQRLTQRQYRVNYEAQEAKKRAAFDEMRRKKRRQKAVRDRRKR